MSEYTLYLKAYTAARMGFSLPETTCKREALAVALGVRDAKDAQQFALKPALMSVWHKS